MDTNTLREHVIHLAQNSSDEDMLIRAVRLLEGNFGERDFSLVVPSEDGDPSVDGQRHSFGYSATSDPRGSDAHQRSKDGMMFAPIGLDTSATTSNGSHDGDTVRTNVHAVSPSKETPFSDAKPKDEVLKVPQESHQSRGNRRVGVSAAPIAMQNVANYKPRVIPKTEEERVSVLEGVSESHLFSNMDEEEQNVIVDAMEKQEFEAGSGILEEGKPPTGYFYMIGKGTCEVTKQGKHVATLNQGSNFGELEMMYNIPECSASITTVTACTMWTLDQECYLNIVLKISKAKRQLYRDALDHVKFLESMSDYDKIMLSEALVGSTYDDGESLIRFGEKGRWMFIVMEGEVQVVGRDKGQKVDVIKLGSGNVVGELEFLFGHLAVADVVAVGKVKVAKINREHLEKLLGPVLDELKRFVAKGEGEYSHYLAAADDATKKQIKTLEKQKKRTADAGEVLNKVDQDGELVLMDTHADNIHSTQPHTMFRYPLKPAQQGNLLMVGLRENGNIVSWNEAMERVTNYPASEAIGRSFYSFLLNETDQKKLHDAVQFAIKFAGNTEEYQLESEGRENATFAFQRSDGLTKTMLQFTIVPPTVAHKNVSEMLLAVGTEMRKQPPQRHVDTGKWLADNIRREIENEVPLDQKKDAILGYINQFETKGTQSSEATDLRAINVRQLIGQIVMRYSALAVQKSIAVVQDFEDCYVEDLYLEMEVFPEALAYAMSNCAHHVPPDGHVRITASIVEELGEEMLNIQFTDDGPGIPKKVLQGFYTENPEKETGMRKVRSAIEKLGGTMQIQSEAGNGTIVTFRVPFVPQEAEEGEADLSASASVMMRPKQTITTLVVEDSAVHRNMMCALLWERKHAVLPGYSFEDIKRLAEVADILIIDPQQSALENMQQDPFSFLRELAKKISVVITTEGGFDDKTRQAYHSAGFLTLSKPFTAVQAISTMRKSEDKAAKLKAEVDKIAAVRDTFNKTNRGEWKKGAMLGKGSFGEVYEAIDVLTGGKMAVKMMRVTDEMNKKELINEVEVMCTLQHQNIIHYFYCEDKPEENRVNVFMEFAGGGTVQGLLKEKGKLDFSEYVRILGEIVDGIVYTHDMRFVHCDIKTANVLLTADGKCKLGDFGTAKRLDQDEMLYIMQGTPVYMAPECMSADAEEDVGYSYPADIWSLGVVALEMATNKAPFSHIKEATGPMGLMKFVTELEDTPDLSPLFDMDPSVIEFVAACLQPDPQKRPKASQLKEFSIFSQGDANMKDALKALKRAQLLHVLNSFVAFQDPEEIEEQKREKARFANARRESNFFSSDDDDEPEDKEAAFFETSEDEDEDEEPEEEPRKKSEPAAPVGKKSPSPPGANGSSRESSVEPGMKTVASAGSKPMTPLTSSSNSGDGHPVRNLFVVESRKSQAKSPTSKKEVPPLPMAPHPPSGTPTTQAPRQDRVNSNSTSGFSQSQTSSAITENYAIILHDAVLSLLSALKLNDEGENALVDQFKEQLRHNSTSSTGGTRTPNGTMRPNLDELLRRDAELLTKMTTKLSAS